MIIDVQIRIPNEVVEESLDLNNPTESMLMIAVGDELYKVLKEAELDKCKVTFQINL